MKIYQFVLTMSIALSPLVFSEAPKSPTMGDYNALLNRSPFIIKKAVEKAPEVKINTSLTLRGVAALSDGWYVVVVDRKKPKQNIILREGHPANAEGIRLVKVNQNQEDYNKTTVVVMSGGRQINVGYNSADIKKSLAATKAPATRSTPTPRVTQNRPPLPTTANQSNTPPKTNSSGRRPRVRRSTTPPPVPRTQ